MHILTMLGMTLLISSVLGVLFNRCGLTNSNSDPVTITFGFMLLVIGLSILSFILPSSLLVTGNMVAMFVGVGVLGLIVAVKKSGRQQILQTLFSLPILGLVLLIMIFSYIGANEIRFHTSPDIYGPASAIGYFKQNFAFSHLKEHYIQVTGLSTAHWTTNIPNFPSVWNIPDQQLRFTADLIIGSGRIGLPLLGAAWAGILDPIRFYPSFLIGLGILSVWSIGILSIEIIREITLFLKKADLPNYGAIGVMISLMFVLYIGLCPWAAISVLEGTVAQAWFEVACLAQILIFLRATTVSSSSQLNTWKLIVYFSIAPLFTYFIYPFGAPLLLICTFPFGLLLAWEKGFLGKNRVWVLASIPGSLLLIVLHCIDQNLLTTTGQAGHMFLQGHVGGVSIGFPSPFDLLGFSKRLPEFIESGFGLLQTKPKRALISTCLYGVITSCIVVGAIWKMSLTDKCKALLITLPSIILFLLSLLAIYSLMQDPTYNEYVFARLLTMYAILSTPVILGFLISSKPFSTVSSLLINHKPTIAGCCLLFMAWTMTGFFKMTRSYVGVTQAFSPVENCTALPTTNDQIYVAKKTDPTYIRCTAITLCRPFFLLTDDWQPGFKTSTNERMVFSIDPEAQHDPIQFIGKIVIKKSLKGPMTIDDLKQSSHVLWIT